MIITLCIALFVAAVELVYILAHPCKDGHEHQWEVTGAHPMVRVHTYWGVTIDKEDGEPVTQVLERCTGCKDVRTRTLTGGFTLAQLRGEK